jgi:hypothetical protein
MYLLRENMIKLESLNVGDLIVEDVTASKGTWLVLKKEKVTHQFIPSVTLLFLIDYSFVTIRQNIPTGYFHIRCS